MAETETPFVAAERLSEQDMIMILRALGDRRDKHRAMGRQRKWAGTQHVKVREMLRQEARDCEALTARIERADLWVSRG
jgi:hypothetical protein